MPAKHLPKCLKLERLSAVLLALCVSSFISLELWADEGPAGPPDLTTPQVYRVKPGDTLSQILFSMNLGPLYGPKGFVAQIAKLNQKMVRDGGDGIRPGGLIIIRQMPSLDQAPPAKGVDAPPTAKSGTAPSFTAPFPTATPEPILFSDISLSVGADYLALDGQQISNGTYGRLLSELSPALNVDWRQGWSEQFGTHVFLSWQNIRIQPAPQGTSVQNTSPSRSAIGFGFSYRLTPNLSFKMDGGMAQQLFYHAVSTGVLMIDTVPLLRLHQELQFKIIKRGPFAVQASAGGSLFGAGAGSGYDIEAGSGFDLGLQIEQSFKTSTFGCGPRYEERKQKTSILDLNERDLGLLCRFVLKSP